MRTAEDHEKRSEDIADTTRRFVVTLNGGGVGLIFTLASSLTENGVSPKWAYTPVSIFILGLVFVGVSLFMAKDRAIKRRDAARAQQEPPDFSKNKLWQSFTWDLCAFGCFAVGSLFGLILLNCAT